MSIRYPRDKNVFDSFFYFCDSFLQNVSNLTLDQNPRSLIDIESYCGDHTLVMRDGSLLSVISLEGSYSSILMDEMVDMAGRIERKLKAYIAEGDHSFSWYFSCDIEDTDRDIHEKYANSATDVLTNLGMSDAVELVEEQVEVLKRYCHSEKNLFIVYTSAKSLTREEQVMVSKLRLKQNKNTPLMQQAQTFGRGVEVYLNKHLGLVDELSLDFTEVGLISRKITIQEQLFEIRKSLDDQWTSDDWTPCLFGDNQSYQIPETRQFDYSCLGIPKLSTQLLPRKLSVENSHTVRIGDKIYAPLTVELAPRSPQVFNNLFDRLKKDKIPFRIKFDFSNNGQSILGFKTIMASVLAWTPGQEDNKKILEVGRQLKFLQKRGDEIVKFKIVLCTWAPANNPDLLDLRYSKMSKMLTGWGQASASETEGDLAETLFSSVPALTLGNVAPPSAQALYDVVKMAPFSRPGAVWQNGTAPYRSIDGKLIPYMPYSTSQEAWITLIFGPMGSGKSVKMNSYNWALVQHPNCSELPFISIADVGPSSKGLILLCKQYLPKYLRHLALYKKIKNVEDDCINVFDTFLGLRYPVKNQSSFLINFITYLLTADDGVTTPEGSVGIATALVKLAYSRLASREFGNIYRKGVDLIVDKELEELKFELPRNRVLWWDIVDFLFMNNKTHAATLAQRFAVPTLSTLVNLCSDERIKSTSRELKVEITGEKIAEYASRRLTLALNEYPMISGHTRLDFGEARIISLDLDEVAKGKGVEAERRKGIAYMVAYNVLTKKFYTDKRHLEEMAGEVGHYKVDYRPYHEKEIDSISRIPKRFCIDEKHSVKGQTIVEEQLDTAIVEARKWQIELLQASQLPDDFSEKSIDLATNILILGVGSESNKKKIVDRFKLNPTLQYHLSNSLRRPNKHGSTFIGMFSTDKGWVKQLLVDTKGPRFLWATNSSRNDDYVREYMSREIGDIATRKVLAELYPSGSLDEEIEKRLFQQGLKRKRDEFREEMDVVLKDDAENENISGSLLKQIAIDTLNSARSLSLIDRL